MTAAPAGRELAPAVPLLAQVVATVSVLTGLAMAGAGAFGHAFGPWVSPDPLGPAMVGAGMLGVAPGLFALSRARSWPEARTLTLSTAIVLIGLFAVTLGNAGSLHIARGGPIVLVLFSLGWVAVTGLLALLTAVALAAQYRKPAGPGPAAVPAVPLPAVSLPAAAKPALALLGSAWFGIGAGLLALPGFWSAYVPWPVSRADAQALGVWALALGAGVLASLAEDDLARLRPALPALPGVALAIGVLLAARAGDVHWHSGPAIALLAMTAGLLLAGLTGRLLLRAAPAAP